VKIVGNVIDNKQTTSIFFMNQDKCFNTFKLKIMT